MYNNEITIKYEDIIKEPDNTIDDPETIRQIALYGLKYGGSDLYPKIKKGFEFCALYPHIHKFESKSSIIDDLVKERFKNK